MNPENGVVHVRAEQMDDKAWERYKRDHGLVPLPANRQERRAAEALARRSSRARQKQAR